MGRQSGRKVEWPLERANDIRTWKSVGKIQLGCSEAKDRDGEITGFHGGDMVVVRFSVKGGV
jgi:hypothetical protein